MIVPSARRSTLMLRLRKSIGLNGACTKLSTGGSSLFSVAPHVGCAPCGLQGTDEESLAAARGGRRLHGDDRQPAIWLDAVRAADPRQAWLAARRHPGGVLDLRHHRGLAGAARGLVRRPLRPAPCRGGGWSAGRRRVG